MGSAFLGILFCTRANKQIQGCLNGKKTTTQQNKIHTLTTFIQIFDPDQRYKARVQPDKDMGVAW